jgi:PAS domain S-box-containing protein
MSRYSAESRMKEQPAQSYATSAHTARVTDLLTLSHEPILTWRLAGGIELWNAGAERLYGFSPEEALGRVSHALLQTKFPIEVAELTSLLQNRRYWSGELRHTCKDGREVIVDCRMQLLDDDVVLEVNRDVTALRESEQRMRWIGAVVESSDDAIVSKNLDGIITSWNSGAERLFNYMAEEAIGRSITIIIPPDRLDEERMILARIRRGERIDHYETVRRRRYGDLVNISSSVSPVKNAEGEIVGASKVARDITEQKRSQEHIAVLAREAEHRSKNLLSSVQAIISLSRSDTSEGLKAVISGRIQAMANAHSLFVEARWTGAELSAIATQELAPYLDLRDVRVHMEGPNVLLKPDAAQAVALLLHELATNAAKYGALSDAKGQIKLTWSHSENGRLTLRWIEFGGPRIIAPERQGFGSRLIEGMVGQLGGAARFDWLPEGLVCEVVFQP